MLPLGFAGFFSFVLGCLHVGLGAFHGSWAIQLVVVLGIFLDHFPAFVWVMNNVKCPCQGIHPTGDLRNRHITGGFFGRVGLFRDCAGLTAVGWFCCLGFFGIGASFSRGFCFCLSFSLKANLGNWDLFYSTTSAQLSLA